MHKYMSRKYYIICFIKKRKYIDYKDLLFKYINNSKYIFFQKYY